MKSIDKQIFRIVILLSIAELIFVIFMTGIYGKYEYYKGYECAREYWFTIVFLAITFTISPWIIWLLLRRILFPIGKWAVCKCTDQVVREEIKLIFKTRWKIALWLSSIVIGLFLVCILNITFLVVGDIISGVSSLPWDFPPIIDSFLSVIALVVWIVPMYVISAGGVIAIPLVVFGGLPFGIWLIKSKRLPRLGKVLIIQVSLMFATVIGDLLIFTIFPIKYSADATIEHLGPLMLTLALVALQSLLAIPVIIAGIFTLIRRRKIKCDVQVGNVSNNGL